MKSLSNFKQKTNVTKLVKKQLLTVKGGEVDSKKLSEIQQAIISNMR